MVAMTVWPTDGADGSVATEARWRKMGRIWTPSGVVDNVSGELVPSLAFPNLTVQAGAVWVDGHYAELTGSQVLTVTANGLVVVRFDPAANSAELLYRDGASTPNQSPTGVWELPVAKLVGSVMTDLRGALVNPALDQEVSRRLSGVGAMGQTTSLANVQVFGGGTTAAIGAATAPTVGRYLALVEAACFSTAGISTANLDIFCTETGIHSPGAGYAVPVGVAQSTTIPISMMGYFDFAVPGVYSFSIAGVLTAGTSFYIGHRTLTLLRVQNYNQT